MQHRATRYFRLAGFRITVDPLLPLVIVLIGWLLSERYFPGYTLGYIPELNYILGGVASVLLTLSILFHEFGHAITAVRLKLPIDRIHLYLFGGMAELKHRPVTAKQELLIALSGPIASFFLAFLAWVAGKIIPENQFILVLLLQFVTQINLLLAVFNLIPIFPLDGGRATRAGLWRLLKQYYPASIATLYTSFALIGVMLVITVLDFLFLQSGYQLIMLLLTLYLCYTVISGRRELVHRPEFTDLLYRLDNQEDLPSIVEQIRESDTSYLKRTILPLVRASRLEQVMNGAALHNEAVTRAIRPSRIAEEIRVETAREPQAGDIIDLSNSNTFDKQIKYTSDFVPVTQNGYFLGMADANELRFWLNERGFYTSSQSESETDESLPQSTPQNDNQTVAE